MDITAARVSKAFINRFAASVGIALVLSACNGNTDGNTNSNTNSNTGQGSPATPVSTVDTDQFVLEVQPIQVCDDGGLVCAQVNFFETITDKIWEQADIDVTFLPLNRLNDSTYLSTNDREFADLSFSGGAGAFGRHPGSTSTTGPINLWFVDKIESSNGLLQFGNAWVGFNGALISDDIFDFNNGAGRKDVIAHELGHNLGLRHSTFGAGGANNLMSSGAVRTVPDSVDDIFPDGDNLSQLTPEQIAKAQSSSFVKDVSANPPRSVAAVPVAAADGVSQLVSVPMALVDVPEASPSFLTWLVLLPLGPRLYRRTSR